MKTIVIQQPSYLPWIGYFDQIRKADVFVFLDDVLFTKNDWRNRNRIKTPQGIQWITVPVHSKRRLRDFMLIKDTKIADESFYINHCQALKLNYTRAKCFPETFLIIKNVLEKKYENICDLNICIIKEISNYLGIRKTKFIRSSELSIQNNNPTKRLVMICKKFDASVYLSPNKSKDYLDEKLFKENEIILEYQNYKHPTYRQLWGEFIPFLSIVDLVFNEGKNSLNTLSNKLL